MKLLGPWFLSCTSHSSCSGSLPSENHLRYRRAVRALRCPPFTLCSAAQTKSLASPQSHATKTCGHHSSKPGHQITSAKPQITSSPLGCIGVPERKRGNWVLCNKIWPSERKGETQGPFCVRFAWGPPVPRFCSASRLGDALWQEIFDNAMAVKIWPRSGYLTHIICKTSIPASVKCFYRTNSLDWRTNLAYSARRKGDTWKRIWKSCSLIRLPASIHDTSANSWRTLCINCLHLSNSDLPEFCFLSVV